MSCEKRRIFDPFLPKNPDGLCTFLMFYASVYTGLQVGLVSWYPRVSSFVVETLLRNILLLQEEYYLLSRSQALERQ